MNGVFAVCVRGTESTIGVMFASFIDKHGFVSGGWYQPLAGFVTGAATFLPLAGEAQVCILAMVIEDKSGVAP